MNGYKLMQDIREAKAERDQAAALFTPSLVAFPDEEKPDPRNLAASFIAAEKRLARLQMLQARYNMAVTVTVEGESLTLLEAIKRSGGASRLEKMWKSAAMPERGNRWERSNDKVRAADAVAAKPVVSYAEAGGFRKEAARYASALRAAIQIGNAKEVAE